MKKVRIITLCFVLLFSLASLAYAELPANRIALGVQLGATVSQVRNVFGVPVLAMTQNACGDDDDLRERFHRC